jgi:Zn-dependent metalloprotease
LGLFGALLLSPQALNAQLRVKHHPNGVSITHLRYHSNALPTFTPQQFFQNVLQLNGNHELWLKDTLQLNSSVYRLTYRQFFNRLEVVNSQLLLIYSRDKLLSYSGFYLPLSASFNTEASLPVWEAEATYRHYYAIDDREEIRFDVQKVIMLNPDSAAWSNRLALLCYKVTPVRGYEGNTLYLDAHNGQIYYDHELTQAANFNTYYYGAQSLPNLYRNSPYNNSCFYNHRWMLHTDADARWKFLVTDTLRFPLDGYDDCSAFYDNDNNWDEPTHVNYAQDAYWGVYNSFDYFANKFGHYGLNGIGHAEEGIKFAVLIDVDNHKQISGLHDNALFYRRGVDNDTWEDGRGTRVKVYPDYLILVGRPLYYEPFASIDIMAHELTHGINENLTELQVGIGVEGEAIEEGLADIWAAVIEHEYAPTANQQDMWTIGELPMRHGNTYLRNMAVPNDPNAQVQMLNMHGDTIWRFALTENSAQTKYKLSGVLSHWFYLLVQGDGCIVEGMAIDKAAKLVFSTLQLHGSTVISGLESYRNFADATAFTMHEFLENSNNYYGLYDSNYTEMDYGKVIYAWSRVGITDLYEYLQGAGTGQIFCPGEVSNTQTWSGTMFASHDVTVNAGAHLTITGTVHFTSGNELIVKPGGRLTVNGGTLTNNCDDKMWGGIRVLGHSNMPQNDFSQNGQSRLHISNGATIEHAVCAIRNFGLLDNGNINYRSTGARISAIDAHFIDNAQMISFAPYTNAGYVATSFKNCEFKILPTYDFDHLLDFNFVSLHGIKNIYFYGCDFALPSEFNAVVPWVNAISGFNAHFEVRAINLNPLCFNCNNYDRSTFSGFETAISVHYSGAAGIANIAIDKSDFNNVNNGVFLHAYPTFSVSNSNFVLGNGRRPLNSSMLTGIAAELTPVFDLYENSFDGRLNKTTGIHIINSLTNNSYTYKNSFNNMTIGQHFSGFNRIPEGLSHPDEGLRYFCNVNTGNGQYDVLVDSAFMDLGGLSFIEIGNPFISINIYSNEQISNYEQGVAYHQYPGYTGNDNIGGASSGNVFSEQVVYHIADEVSSQKYSASPIISEQPTRTIGNVGYYVEAPSSCPSRNSGEIWYDHIDPLVLQQILPDGQIDPTDNNALSRIYTYLKNDYNTLNYHYKRLMDGGNTEALIENVQEWEEDVWKVRQELLQKAPFVSEEVLYEEAKDDILPQALRLEVCLANPDATKDPEFIKFLQYEKANPMPAYMINIIKSSWNEKTLRTVMEEEMSKLASNRDFFFNHMLLNMMKDSTLNPNVLRTKLLDRGSLNDYFFVAETYLSEGEYDNAFRTIYDYTQLNPGLSEITVTEIENYQEYLSWLENLEQSGKNIYQLDDYDIQNLVDYVHNSIGRGRVLAHNILCGLYEVCIEDIPERKLTMQGQGNENANRLQNTVKSAVIVLPNPAKEYASFIWDFGSSSINNYELRIRGVDGKSLINQQLSGAQGQWVWDTRSMPGGVYLYEVTVNGLQMANGKVVVVK